MPIPISVDTSKAEVMEAAVRAGAGLINDVYALRRPGALQMAADLGVPVCLMHMQGEPRTMQLAPDYNDVSREVLEFLQVRAQACMEVGIDPGRILIDPGFGFGKTLAHNLRLLKELARFVDTPYPVVVGVSRKSMIGQVLDAAVDERLWGSLGLTVYSALQGAAVLRVHDVKPTSDALRMIEAVQSG